MAKDGPEQGALRRVEGAVTGTPAAEHILNVLKGVLASVPFAGGLSSLITDYIPSARSLRLEEFARQVAKDLRRLSDRVNEAELQTDEFAFMFERAFRGAAENYQREKLEAFRGILVNAAIRRDVPQEEKEYFLVLVNNLSVLHLRMLRFMVEPKQYLSEVGIEEQRVRGGFTEMFALLLPGLDRHVIESAFGDLYQSGLISTDKSIFHTMTSGQGLQLLANRVLPLGLRFIEFCRVPVA